jgi:hypothetical protein
METLIKVSIILLIAFVAIVASEYLKSKQSKSESDQKIIYHKNKYFLTDAEKNFFFVLKPIADRHNLIILSKVRLLDLFFVPHYDRSSRSRIIQKHVDFVLCEPRNIDPVCAIELDDSSHKQESRIERDDFVNQVFDSAGLPLIRIKNSYSYDPQNIEEKIKLVI